MTGEYRKNTFAYTLLRGLAACVGGLLLIIWGESVTTLLIQIAGVALILVGGYLLFGFVAKPLPDRSIDSRLTRGLLMLLLGIVMLTMAGSFKSLLGIIINIALIFCGLERLRMGLYMHRLKLPQGKWLLISSVLVIAAGILFLVLEPTMVLTTTVILYGVYALVEGLLGIASAFIFHKLTKPVIVKDAPAPAPAPAPEAPESK